MFIKNEIVKLCNFTTIKINLILIIPNVMPWHARELHKLHKVCHTEEKQTEINRI